MRQTLSLSYKNRVSYAVGSLLFVFALVGADVNAASLSPQQAQKHVDRLMEATDLILQAKKTGSRHLAKSKLRIASYRVRLVHSQVKRKGLPEVEGALQVTVEKLQDRHLSNADKIYIGLDCMSVAIPALVQETIRGRASKIKGAITNLKLARKLGNAFVFSSAESALLGAQDVLHTLPRRVSREALDAIQIAIEKINDNFLTDSEKQYFVKDCVKVAIQSLRNARPGGGGGGGGPRLGSFYPAVGQNCQNFCASQGLSVGLSPEGAQCVSGENRAASSYSKVNFVYGVWPNNAPHNFSSAESIGQFCYAPGQKRDRDRTDITVGCFCN